MYTRVCIVYLTVWNRAVSFFFTEDQLPRMVMTCRQCWRQCLRSHWIRPISTSLVSNLFTITTDTMRCRYVLRKWSPLRIPQTIIMGRIELKTLTVHRQAKKILIKLFNNLGFLVNHSCVQERLLHISRVKCKSHSKSSSSSLFLTPGFQPSKISGDNMGFYQGSTFYAEKPPGCLPILDASVVL